MKFDYKGGVEQRQAKAYIDRDGDLILPGGIIIWANGSGADTGFDFEPEKSCNKRVFYEGDTITITF